LHLLRLKRRPIAYRTCCSQNVSFRST